jgi:DNA mismatch repair protein MutL
LEEQIILHICKAAAVKAGQVLSTSEMQSLVRQLERCTSPHTCPHGRPTLIHLSAEQLAREFGRT